VNKPDAVNEGRLSGPELEKALAERLRELLGKVSWLSGWKVERNPAPFDRAFDLLASLPLPNNIEAELWVECKAEPRPSRFPSVAVTNEFKPEGGRRARVPVLAAPYISPRMAEICWSHNWSWFDLAGNCRLSVPGAFYLEASGKEPVHGRPAPAANLSSAESARILRVFLTPDNIGMKWTQRDIQRHCAPAVSLGLVNKVVRYLREQAFIEEVEDEGLRLRDPQGLLKAWRDAYRFDRHWRRTYFTLLQGRKLQELLAPLESVTGGHAAYAVFSAAELQAPHVRQSKTWLYLGSNYEQEIGKLPDVKEVDTGENLVVYFPEDDGVFYGQEGDHHGRLPSTSPIQTYLDLSHCGGRGQEAAEALLEQKLKPLWKAHGLISEKP
jgi:hypothetical protein